MITITHDEPGIFQLHMDDTHTENRMSEAFITEFLHHLEQLSHNPNLRVLVLSGRQDVFCAGATLEALQEIASGNFQARDLLLLKQLLNFPMPTIGALEGHAVGGGLILALCCDISVAAESSRYGANFTAMGFTPGGGITNLLPTLVGYNFAMEMMLTARFYKGRDLAQRGLFNYVLPKDEVLPQALTLARAIADKPAHVLEMLKDTLSLPRRQALLEAQGREHLLHKICFSQKQTQSHLEQAYLA